MSFIPITPAGTPLTGLAADTLQEAMTRVMKDAAHMPYRTWEHFLRRGYSIEEWPHHPAKNPPCWYGSGGSDGSA